MPLGEIVKPMERGQITIPAALRGKLNINKNTPLNVFDWRGMIVVVPINISAQTGYLRDIADWKKDTSEEYMEKVRYNPLEELWAKMVRGK
jgi:AbrB family looped-hinge helix DNA binding protein